VPSLASSLNVNSAAQDFSTLTTTSFTPTAGDVLVVKGSTESSISGLNTPTDTQGNTYTLRGFNNDANHCWAALWTAVAGSSTSMTVSVASSGGAVMWHSVTVEQWTDALLAASPAVNSTETGSGSPSTTLTTTQPLSAMSWMDADWAAQSPTGRVYDSTSAVPTEDGIHDKSAAGKYVAYYAWQTATSAGSQTFGLTSPGGQTWTLLGIEVLDIPGPGAPEDPDQAEPIKMWQ
jgi:hypothetical protein